MKTPVISIVIPNRNRVDDVLMLLRSISEQDYQDYEVIVVDDASEDKSISAIQSQFLDVEVVALDRNQGPAVARNAGIHKTRGSIIVGLDSDVVLPDKNTLTCIASKFVKFPELDCLAMRILNFYSHKDDVKSWWHPFSIDEYNNREFFTDYFSGTGYAFRRKVFENAGYYSEDLFMHGEEKDLAFRILDSGFDIVYCPTIAVLHKASQQSRNKLIPLYYHRRNQIWIVTKYYPFCKGVAFLLPRLLKTFLSALLKGGFISYARAILDGISGISHARKLRHPLKSKTWLKIKYIHKGQYSRLSKMRGNTDLSTCKITLALDTLSQNKEFCSEAKLVNKRKKLRVCVACSPGGHMVQVRKLAAVYEKYDYFYFTFSGGVADEMKKHAHIRTIPDIIRYNPLTWITGAVSSLYIAAVERPDVVITTGAGVVVFFCIFAKLLGAKLVFLESLAKVKRPTVTARLLYPFTDLFLVQWPGLLKFFPKAKYLGRLF